MSGLRVILVAVAGVTLLLLSSVLSDTPVRASVTTEASGTMLRNGTGLYPRVIRLQHSGSANGTLLSSVVDFDAGGGVGEIYHSTDDGATFSQISSVHDPSASSGLCCTTLMELPKQIGALPAGTVLWAGSMGQNAANGLMSLRVWSSADHGVTWSYLSSCQIATSTGGLWEPELSVDSEGDLVCHYSDATNPAQNSQSLQEVFSSDGLTWSKPYPTVAPPNVNWRAGMAVVTQLGSGSYYMVYEVCSTGGQYDCAVHYRTSQDGANWGPPNDVGTIISTATGQYFSHAPTVAWLDNGTASGRLVVVGEQFHEANGALATTSGRTVLVNTEGGVGNWFALDAPVAVPSPDGGPCANYSSALLPSTNGAKLLEIATDHNGSLCTPYYATGSAQGTGDAFGAGLSTGQTYRLINVLSGDCLDVAADSRVAGGNVQQWTCNGLGPQNYRFDVGSPGQFTLTGQNSNLCVGVDNGGTAPGDNVSQWTCDGSASEQWRAVNEGDGYWTFVNVGSGLCLDVAGGSTQAGANVQQWNCNKLSPQIWKLEPTG